MGRFNLMVNLEAAVCGSLDCIILRDIYDPVPDLKETCMRHERFRQEHV